MVSKKRHSELKSVKMDQFENKLRQLYQERKDEDDKLIPGFDTFRTDKLSKPLKRTALIFRIAASVAVIAIVTVVFIYRSRNNSKPADNITTIDPMNISNNLPTHSLNAQGLTSTYIWQWKAPTDKLLEDAKQSIKINSN